MRVCVNKKKETQHYYHIYVCVCENVITSSIIKTIEYIRVTYAREREFLFVSSSSSSVMCFVCETKKKFLTREQKFSANLKRRKAQIVQPL